MAKRKQKTITDCEQLAIDNEHADGCYGGFKEYKPPIYEHRSNTDTQVKINNLFGDFNQ